MNISLKLRKTADYEILEKRGESNISLNNQVFFNLTID